MYALIADGAAVIFGESPAEVSRARAFLSALGGPGEKVPAVAELAALAPAPLVVTATAADRERVREALGTAIQVIAVFEPGLVQPSPEAIAALWSGGAAAWQPLAAELAAQNLGSAAPAAFLAALAQRSTDHAAWQARAREAAGDAFAASFAAWLAAGASEQPAGAYADRLGAVAANVDGDVLGRCRAFCDELAAARQGGDLQAHAQLVLAARSLEEGEWTAAETAADAALALSQRWTTAARRLRAGAWLGRRELERGQAELTAVLAVEAAGGALVAAVLSTKRTFADLEPGDAAARAVSLLAQSVADPAGARWTAAMQKLSRSRPR